MPSWHAPMLASFRRAWARGALPRDTMTRSSDTLLGAATSVALAAAILLPAVGAWQIIGARDATLDDARRTIRTLGHVLAQHAERTVDGVDAVVSMVVRRVDEGADPAALGAFLRTRPDRGPRSNSLAVADAEGRVMADPTVASAPVSVRDRDYFAWHRDHPDPTLHFGGLVTSRLDGRPAIPVSRRLSGPAGAFAGVVVSALRPEDFQAFFDDIAIGPHGAVGLWSDDGQLLVRRPRVVGGPASQGPIQSKVTEKFGSTTAGLIETRSSIDGIDRIVAFEHLADYPLVLSVSMSVDDVLARWRHGALVQGLVLALASIALAGLAVGLERGRRLTAIGAAVSRETDRRYRLLAENSADLVTLRPRSSFARSFVSPASEELLGWTPEEFAGMKDSAFIHPDDLERVRGEMATLSPDRPRLTIPHRLVRRDGTVVHVEARVGLASLPDGSDGVIVAARDVTGRHFAEEALKDSEARYRLLADRSSDMVSRLDLDAVRLYVSPASFEILGRTPGELVGTRPTDFVHDEEVDRVGMLLGCIGRGEADQGRTSHRVRHADGSWIWVDAVFRLVRDPASGRPLEIVSSLRDITTTHALQQQVEAGATLLAATLDTMDEGLLVVTAAREVRVCNRRAAEILDLHQSAIGHEVPGGPSLGDDRFAWLFDAAGEANGVHRQHDAEDGRCLEVRRMPMRDGSILLTLGDITHLKRAETRAQGANRFLTMAEEVAHVGHWRLSLSDGVVTWSDEVFRIHGLPIAATVPGLEEVISHYHPDDRGIVSRTVAEAIATRGSFEFNLRIVRPDGEVRHVISRGRCEVDQGHDGLSGLFGVFMDVTELGRVQRELSATTSHLKATLDNMDQGLIKVAADGTIELANRRFAELLELPPELLGGRSPNFEDVLQHLAERGEYAKGAPGFESRVRDVGAPLTLGTYERSRPDGRVLEVRTVPAPDGAVVRTYSDITSRRQAEAAVRESEAQYRMLADSTSDVITKLDLDFKRRYVSPSCRSVFGYEPSEMLEERPSNFVHADDVVALRSCAEKLVAGGFPADRTVTTYRFQHKRGHWIWIEAALNLLRDEAGGAPLSIICSLRDISERQRIARHLESARAAAENAARVKSEFLANMSHELRTPLTGILGIHDLLDGDATLGPAQRRYLGLARDAGRSLLAIVNDVLDFSKIEAGQLCIEAAPFELGTLVEACRALAEGAATAKGLRVEARVVGRDVTLNGDAARLRQVLLNLLTNAVKFTETGEVSVVAAYDFGASTLRVAVSDTGIGIPADKLQVLFERFSQADSSITRRFGGTGLGLAICRHLVEMMGGTIAVTSDPGRGSTFTFTVPLDLADAASEAQHAVPTRVVVQARRVLLAEDNGVNQDIIRAMLERRGHHVTAVGDGEAAMRAIAEGPGFDLVLMDIQMPVMDGLTATAAIRAAEAAGGRARIPIIGLTANAMSDDVERCREAGMDGHVAKPIDWPILFAAIDATAVDRGSDGVIGDASDVLDDATLETLAGFIGRDMLGDMLRDFRSDLEARLAGIEAAPSADVAARAHSLVSIAGQLGFLELSRACVRAEAEARRGCGGTALDDVRTAADRALAAARTSRHVLAR